ncbi:hypothetical protein BGZ96_003337 [Linnemannia gamsii]|uniref:Transcription regulator Rua1 C-terminal domain-containing protein n=1 Tax=Linnemannia gamsii TaxID=64522 RepID=A0ABQ7JJS6_9FUNG|nr:hypothetical protein BGZ96_003337 [Linnemannia gamsii]
METSIHAQTMSQAHTVTPRPLWFENQGHGLTHRASFHSLLSMGSKEDRLRARQDRGSIISLASTVGDDSPSDFTHFDFEHPIGDLHSQQSSSGGGLGYDTDEYDHHGIGTGLAMMSFLDFMPQSRSSPGDNSVDGDVRSAQPSRSNSVILDADTANMIRMNSMFTMGEEPLHLQPEQFNNSNSNSNNGGSNHASAQMHPLSKESSSDLSMEQSGQVPGQHPNETEGMLPSIWSSNSVDMMAASVHPFSMPTYENKAHPLSNPSSDPTLLENNSGNEQGSLEQQALRAYEQNQDHARAGFQPSMPPNFTNPSGYFVNNDAPVPPLSTHISMANLVQQQQAHQHQQQQLRFQQQAQQQQLQHAQHQQALQQQQMHQQRLHLRSQTLAASQSPHVRNLSSPGVEYAKSPHSLTPPLHPQQQQLNQKMYGTPTGAPNFAASKAAARVRNRTISSPAGSFQYSPSSMGSTPTSVQMTRPPSGLSFGPIPVRERKRSLMDANMAQGLDQVRQSLPGANQQSAGQPSSDSSHLTTPSGASSAISSGDDKGANHSPFHIKQEPTNPTIDHNLIGLGLGAANTNNNSNANNNSCAAPEENYHRKRTKSVDMYSSYMGSLNSFNPPTSTAEMGSASLTGAPNQGTSVQNWQPPDMALHLQVYQNSISNMGNGLGSVMPPASVPLHMQMNGQGVHPHHVSAAGGPMGGESNLYQLSNMPMAEPVHTLRHSISHDRMDPSYGLPPQQMNGGVAGAKAKAKPKTTKAAGKGTKAKGRSMSMGDALDPEAVAGMVNGFGGNNAGASGAGAGASAGGDDEEGGSGFDEAAGTAAGASGHEFEGSELHGDPTARKQKLRYEGDQYTPQWVRNVGQAKEGFCDTCVPGKWLQLKNSAFWYHKQFFHGISSVSGKLFSNPIQTRQMEQDDIEGLCHQCNEWIPISNHKRQNSMLWYRHAHKCHIYHKPKTQGQSSNRSSFSAGAGQTLPGFTDAATAAAFAANLSNGNSMVGGGIHPLSQSHGHGHGHGLGHVHGHGHGMGNGSGSLSAEQAAAAVVAAAAVGNAVAVANNQHH